MKELPKEHLITLDMGVPVWGQVYTVAPLVIIGTREGDTYDLAPKHMATPMSFENYFGFVCTPRHHTYQNVKEYGYFTVSFPTPDQIVTASLSASRRKGEYSKSDTILDALPVAKATTMNAPLVKDAYLYLECSLFKIVDGFGENSLICGSIEAAYADERLVRISDIDEGEQLQKNPLLAYIAHGRFARISETFNFPFPKDFSR